MSRWPVAAFAALVLATIAAFFITQHLKSSGPLIIVWGYPAPFSDAAGGCRSHTTITFNVQHQSDRVTVWVIDSEGNIVRTIASGVHMSRPTAGHHVRRTFSWYGREADGQPAPAGTYHFRVYLADQGRTVDVTQDPVVIDNTAPHLLVTRVDNSQLPAQGGAPATVHFTGSHGRGGDLLVYRTSATAQPQLATVRHIPFSHPSGRGYAKTWDGRVDGRPAPPGTYVMALKVTNRACVTGTFPDYLPPQAGSTAHAGVTVSYLAAEPPLDPVAPGSVAVVGVSAHQQRYHWALRRVGVRKPVAHGAGTSTSLRVRLPRRSPGLYALAIRTAGQRTEVPLVAGGESGRGILVVLPALTWQGENAFDDNGDGFPDTLANASQIDLERPLADGLPSDFGGEAALLAYLDHAGLRYQLTTDLALATGSGSGLAHHAGVVFAGSERWLPAGLAPALRTYVDHGGRVLSFGADGLLRTAQVQGSPSSPAGLQAVDPTSAASTDVLGAHIEPLVTGNTEAIIRISDDIGLFSGTSGTFLGFGSFAPIPAVAPPARIVAAAGTTTQTPSIVAYRLDSGLVVDVALPTFTASLAGNVDARELVRRLWTIFGA